MRVCDTMGMMESLSNTQRLARLFFYVAVGFVVYMPLHVFIAQSVSLTTGGIVVWKAAKDVVLFALLPVMLYGVYQHNLMRDKAFARLFSLSVMYAVVHTLFLVFDSDDHARSTLTGMVFNLRVVVFLLLGVLVAQLGRNRRYLQYAATAAVLIATLVAVFGVAQYFLPHDFLSDFGYSKERGVPPLFFIDDKPDLPRVMSTLKDPNSLGAYLILPTLLAGYAFLSNHANKQLFVRPFRRGVLAGMVAAYVFALFLTFSRGAALGLCVAAGSLGVLQLGPNVLQYAKRYWALVLVGLLLAGGWSYMARDSYVFQNVVFHADESTTALDPNEKRIAFAQDAIGDVIDEPLGYGPGTAGLVAISNPNGGVLTENYFLQVFYEVGWLGGLLFIGIIGAVGRRLYALRQSPIAVVLLAALGGYVFYSFFIHLWSNEAVALQWWLLAGAAISTGVQTKVHVE